MSLFCVVVVVVVIGRQKLGNFEAKFLTVVPICAIDFYIAI